MKAELLERISADPEILHGNPCIKNTRIPVHLIVSLIAEGAKEEEILSDYPSLSREDISAALHYAALCTASETYPL